MNYNKNITTIISSSVLLFMSFLIILVFSACSNADKTPKMYIEKGTLTEEEKDIAFLLGVGDDRHIYNIKTDDTIQSIQVNTYELINDEWQMISISNMSFSDTESRLSLSFENLVEGLQVALLGENERDLNKYFTDFKEELEGMSRATSMLTDKTEIVYEKEIPLAIQIMTTKSSFISYFVESFYTPEDYTNLGYEHVLAVSIIFSQKNVSELSPDKE